jgi:hypothetical protein
MLRRYAHRLTITLCVLVALLFARLALATYACPSEPEEAAAAVSAMEMAPGEPCEGMAMLEADEAQPVLCHQHCVDAPQSFDPVSPAAVTPPAIVHVLVVPALLDGAEAESVVYADLGNGRPPPDPLFLSTLRLRV